MAYLRIFQGETLKEEVELQRDQMRIGRAKDNDVVLKEPGVSSHHATIMQHKGAHWIEDNGSTNGVYVNNEKIARLTQLKYWDEIQIYNYVLKFLAVPGHKDEDRGGDGDLDADKTMVVDLSSKAKLERLRRQKKVALVSYRDKAGEERRHPLGDPTTTIGRAKTCDIRVGGWFAPAQAATLQLSGFGYILTPNGRGQVQVNGEPINAPKKITEGDNFEVKGTLFQLLVDLVDE